MTFSSNFLVATLQPKIAISYEVNLMKLIETIQKSNANLIVAPELCLTNFDYENFEESASFYFVALPKLLKLISTKILLLTMIVKEKNKFYNRAIVLHNHKVIHFQNKNKLFTLGDECKYFTSGKQEEVVPFSIDGIRYGILICFELRFKELWKALEGVDIILIPAQWGKSRKQHLEVLSQSLAIMNQTFVLLSNSSDDDMASSSAIISPWGNVVMNDKLEVIEEKISLHEIKKVRRMIQMR